MLISTEIASAAKLVGEEKAVEWVAKAGFDAVDISLCDMRTDENPFNAQNYKEFAESLVAVAKKHGVYFNQAHAPFGGGYDHYTSVLVPQFPRVFAFCELLGVKQIIVHPLQRGRYYGHEQELFEMNMEFYKRLIPYCDVVYLYDNSTRFRQVAVMRGGVMVDIDPDMPLWLRFVPGAPEYTGAL